MDETQHFQGDHGQSRRRVLITALVAVLLGLGSGIFSPAQAQTTSSHRIRIGDTVNDSLDARTFGQVYVFDATKGDRVSFVAVSKTRGLFLALLLTDSNGVSLSQVAALATADVSIRNYSFAQTGTYYLTVLRATGIQANFTAAFSLTLSGTVSAPVVGPVVTLASGMSVALNWNSTDDMTIEVRDPVGGAVNLNTPVLSTGAQLSGSSNAGCKAVHLTTGTTALATQAATSTSAQQTVSWPKGSVSSGSYEILAYFKQSCPQGIKPLPFTLTITVDGTAQPPIQGQLDAQGEVYVASFVLNSASDVIVRKGGPNLGADLSPVAARISTPIALGTKTTATGALNNSNPADAYSFIGKTNQVISIAQSAANGGSLDSLLLLLDQGGNIISTNDDANPYTRDALIANFTLRADGIYTIVATRYAIANGGTEGGYKLTLTFGQVTVPVATAPVAGSTPAATLNAIPAITSTIAPGQPAGSIEISVTWNNSADLRLWVRDPQGARLYTDIPKTNSGGALSKTANFGCPTNATAIANAQSGATPQDFAYWSSAKPPTGTYEVRVWQESDCGDVTVTSYNLTINVKGQQVAQISNQNPGPNKQSFLTTFTIAQDGSVSAGQSGQVTHQFTANVGKLLQTAPPLAYNQTVAGQISGTNTYALYTFNAIKGDRITLTMRNTSGTLDTEVYLLNLGANNVLTQLAYNNGVLNPPAGTLGLLDSQIAATIPADGTYVIATTRFGVELGATTGGYTLTLNGPTGR